jgi:integrase
MSVYSVKGKGWRYDFTLRGERHTEAWFKTRREVAQAEAKRKEELNKSKSMESEIPTDMAFLDLVNVRLDFVKAYRSDEHYKTHVYMARRWIMRWGKLLSKEITHGMVEQFLIVRRGVSPYTANKELRHLRAVFNYGKKKRYINQNPTDGIDFFPVEKRIKYVPSSEDIETVISLATQETQDYLWTIKDTFARVGEINRLTWDDVDLQSRYVILYTRKKKGGNLTPRKVPMTERVFEILSRLRFERDKNVPWVFCNRYTDWKSREKKVTAFGYRKTVLKTLCKKAGVREFTFHALRHSGASIMDNHSVPIGAIQRILGHENRTTTEIYLHNIGHTEVDAVTIYERATKKSHTDSHTTLRNKGALTHAPSELIH